LEAKVVERTAELEDAVQRLRQSQEETERKNRQLNEAKVEVERKNRLLDSKVAELARKNEDLIASQKQADRIFSALAEALPGTVLDEKYRLDEKIGAGGFGAVFRATHLTLNRPIAVKVFRPSPGNDSPDAIERFRREGVSACRVNHPNAITVLDSNISADGIAYIVMELLEGHTLTQEIRSRGRLSLKRCAAIIVPVCRALAEAHALGIVHRDIKPDNIFLHHGKEGEIVKVVDFGIAKLIGNSLEAQDQDLTSTGGIVGTPVYMSPERLRGDDYDGRADVYSVGVTLYEMLAGRVPFQPTSKGLVEVILRHIKETPESLRSLNPSIPPEVEEIVKKALVKDPERRPTAREFADEFALIAAELEEIELERSMVPGAHMTFITNELNGLEPMTDEQKLTEVETSYLTSPSEEMPTLLNISLEVKE
jgi:serine/threonine protein kinase